QPVRVRRVQHPPEPGARPVVDHRLDQTLAQSLAPHVIHDEKIGEVGERHAIRDRPGEPDHSAAVPQIRPNDPPRRGTFKAFARDFPDNAVLLIDTYDTLQGARHAMTVAQEMARQGHRLRGVRIDSYETIDELAALSRRVRAICDDAGHPEVQVFLSGDLDEYRIEDLLARRAAAGAFGVGTRMGTSEDAPNL